MIFMMAIEEMKAKMKERNIMFEQARSGEKPICPKCHNGHIICEGDLHFYCDNSECNVKITLDPARE